MPALDLLCFTKSDTDGEFKSRSNAASPATIWTQKPVRIVSIEAQN